MYDFLKEKEQIKLNEYHYYIPYYDILNNEIYFADFFTEELITKPYNFNFKIEGTEKIHLDELNIRKKQDILNMKLRNSSMSELNDEEKLQLFRQENERKFIKYFSLNWEKMKVLSNFNDSFYLSPPYKYYFCRPLFSRNLISQSLGLYTFNSCEPLPNVIASYKYIKVEIEYHLDSLLGTDFDSEYRKGKNLNADLYLDDDEGIEDENESNNGLINNKALNRIRMDIEEISKKSKNISFFYVIDTLIKELVINFEDILNSLLNKYENRDNSEEYEDLNIELDQDKNAGKNEGIWNKKKERINSLMNDKLIDTIYRLKAIFKKTKNDKTRKFLLKVAGSEEYLYGDNMLGNYTFLRDKVRQQEALKLVLKNVPFYEIKPPIFSFPPIIRMLYKNVNYNSLFDKYIEFYPNKDIYYRLYKPDKKIIDRYIKYEHKRTEYLQKYTESGDCDYPLKIKLKSLKHVYSFKYWFDNDLYNKCELILPYFNPIKLLQIKKDNKIKNIFTFLSSCFKRKVDDENNNNLNTTNINEKENKEEDENAIKAYESLVKKNNDFDERNKEFEDNLNYMKIYSKYQYEKYNSMNKGLLNLNINSNQQYLYNEAEEKLLKKEDNINKESTNYDTIKDATKFRHKYSLPTIDTNNIGSMNYNKKLNYGIKVNDLRESKILCYQKNDDKKNLDEIDFNNNRRGGISISPKKVSVVENTKTFTERGTIPDKFRKFQLKNHPPGLIIPVYIRVEVSLLYGSYCLRKFLSEPFLIKDFIPMNETIILDGKHCLISHLPFETRIGISILAFDQKLEKDFILGSCQIPLYKESGQMQKGSHGFRLWPNTAINPRVNNSTEFCMKFPEEKEENNENILRLKGDTDQNCIASELVKFQNKISKDFVKILAIEEEEKENLEKNEELMIKKVKNDHNKYPDKVMNNAETILSQSSNANIDNINEEDEDENNVIPINDINEANIILEKNEEKHKLDEIKGVSGYPKIYIEFPKFSSPLIYTNKSMYNYRDFLRIKHKHSKEAKDRDYNEIRRLFCNSLFELKNIVGQMKKRKEDDSSEDEGEKLDDNDENFFSKRKSIFIRMMDKVHKEDRKEKIGGNRILQKGNKGNDGNEEEYPVNLWDYLKKTLPNLIKILKMDPLDALDNDQSLSLLLCRDYISSIPSALELFLRSIDWRSPLEKNVARSYLAKWAKIGPEEAVSLLDARFPDTSVREYAVNRLREMPDETIANYTLILCQCLLYETRLVNPLSDFLIEKSLQNPRLIGTSFFIHNRVNSKNPLFKERLTAYNLQLLMLAGTRFLEDNFEMIKITYYLELITYASKNAYKMAPKSMKKKSSIKLVRTACDYLNKNVINKMFSFPIDPTFFISKFTDNVLVFNSKMVPTLLEFYTREPKFKKNVIFKIGDDLRQDYLTISMLKLFDRLWLENNLDLKLLSYKVFPTEVTAGFIECVQAKELAQIQLQGGVGGALDRELLVKFLRGGEQGAGLRRNEINKTDNFIKSLAGYCVATCVLGVADRHSSNVMIQSNGIFLHIDYGHILGHFKKKFGFKRERSAFLLTPEMANVYINEKKEEDFKKMCVKAFNILRHNVSKLISPFIIMSTSGMPEFFGIHDIKYMKKMLVLEKPNDEDAGNYFIEEIKKCRTEKIRQIDNIFHNIKQ